MCLFRYRLMVHCWARDPKLRPQFDYITVTIDDLVEHQLPVTEINPIYFELQTLKRMKKGPASVKSDLYSDRSVGKGSLGPIVSKTMHMGDESYILALQSTSPNPVYNSLSFNQAI